MIPFTQPGLLGFSAPYVDQVMKSGRIAGGGPFGKKCEQLLDGLFGVKQGNLLTTSCTHALEMAALLLDLKAGDEVIVPSFTFPSTANAFVLRGAKIVFVDCDPKTMNVDPQAVAAAITPKTRALVVMHYGGVACDMDALTSICGSKIAIVEDAAQSLLASYNGRPLGALGRFGCFSYHETKNIVCGEGGSLFARRAEDFVRAEILREKGTNRAQFFRGAVDKYNWRDIGSSYVMSDLLAAILLSQLERGVELTERRLAIWKRYHSNLSSLAGKIELPHIPEYAKHNAHLFYVKCRNLDERGKLIEHLKAAGISSAFHYVPLHSSPAGQKFGEFHGKDVHTTRESERLLRLPMFYGLIDQLVDDISAKISDFYN